MDDYEYLLGSCSDLSVSTTEERKGAFVHPLIPIDDFLGRMQEIVTPKQSRRVLFATYKSVADIAQGIHNPRKGLTTWVCNGYAIRELVAEAFDLAFVYVGVSDFSEPFEFAMHLATKTPVYIVTCTCGLDRRSIFEEALAHGGGLRGVVVTEYCGGQKALRDIYNTLVQLS